MFVLQGSPMQIQAVLIVCVPPEFIDSAGEGVGFVVWADATKLGRLSNNDLNTMCDSMANVLTKKPLHAVGFLVAPYLCSEKVQNGSRGERRILVIRHKGGVGVSSVVLKTPPSDGGLIREHPPLSSGELKTNSTCSAWQV